MTGSRSTPAEKEKLMSRKFIPCLSLALGAAMIAGTPAFAYSSVTEAVLAQSQASRATTYQDASPSTSASSDLGDRIEQAWAANKDLADADIDARVDGDRVILEGEVRSAAMRQTAERLAKRVKGVVKVDNQIALRMSAAPTNNERQGTKGSVVAGDVKDTARVVGDKTEDAAEATGDAVGTAARKTGSAVGTAAEATKDAVVTGAKKTAEFVKDSPEKVDETWITSKIAGKINADDALENVDVDVKVNKNVVTISGDVPSIALRDRVLSIARETDGVARVVDRMTVRAGDQ
jgi:hyperosmotically inducible protein